MKNIFHYEWKLFLRNKAMVTAWLLMLVIGFYALYYGRSFNNVQARTIYSIDTACQTRVQTQLQNFSADTTTKEGKLKYDNARDPFLNEWHTRPMIWKQPGGLQAMSLGQSDNQPFYYNLWVYNNVYNTKQVELRNPDKLMAGNFDLAFVFIYLLPLFIIACSYNVVSADRETGISGLLSAQGISLHSITLSRLIFRAFLAGTLILALSVAGIIINNVPIKTATAWVLISLLYTLFWFALVYVFVSSRSSGAVTALKLVSAWVILLIVIPSFLNSRQQPNEEAWIEMADASREYSGQIWGMDKAQLADTLFRVKPEWRSLFEQNRDTNQLRSVAYAYFIMQNLNRAGRGIDSVSLQQQHNVEKYNLVNPGFSTQLLYNKLAGTELNSFAEFRKAASDYQLLRNEIIARKRLSQERLDRQAYEAYPAFHQPRPTLSAGDWIRGAGPLLFFILLCIFPGNYYWKINHSIKH